jgi:AraC-like DNA-binding protein
MQLDTLRPSSELQLRCFSEIDEFRPVELLSNCRSIPLDGANFAPIRAKVHLPQCYIVVQRSFARLLDSEYQISGSLLIVPLDANVQSSANGITMDSRSVIALRGRVDCQFIEPISNQHATLIFSESLRDRDWFGDCDKLVPRLADAADLRLVRRILLMILRIASTEPLQMTDHAFAQQLQETLLLAIDGLFTGSQSSDVFRRAGSRATDIVRRVDEYVSTHPTTVMYSSELAAACDVSIRTLHEAFNRVRGMSLHRYLRHRKAYAVRKRLLKGGDGLSVSGCARAHGFHHLGEFAMLYRNTFNEQPSATLARANSAVQSPSRAT